MLGVLRDAPDDAMASLSPQPRLDDITAAVAESVTSGVATDLEVRGFRREVGAGVELAAYRIVQEALTNVRRHAGASANASVRICYDTDWLVVEVDDDGRGEATSLSEVGAGQGIIGMRERVEIYGGAFTSGPRPGGGFAVRAVLPVACAIEEDPA